VHRQNLLFNYFCAVLQADIRAAKAEGRYSEGMSDLPASQISREVEPQVRVDKKLDAVPVCFCRLCTLHKKLAQGRDVVDFCVSDQPAGSFCVVCGGGVIVGYRRGSVASPL
jgi:hypothetical protein